MSNTTMKKRIAILAGIGIFVGSIFSVILVASGLVDSNMQEESEGDLKASTKTVEGDANTEAKSTGLPTPPCSPTEQGAGICQPRNVISYGFFSATPGGNQHAAAFLTNEVANVEDVLEQGLRTAGASPAHLALRGTPRAGSTRCAIRGVARTLSQREAAIRFWLDLPSSEPLPSASQVEQRLNNQLNRINVSYPVSARSNFRALSQGGMSSDFGFLSCYVTFDVHEYVLGSGPSSLEVTYDRLGEAKSFELYRQAYDGGEIVGLNPLSEGEYQEHIQNLVSDVEALLTQAMEDGRS